MQPTYRMIQKKGEQKGQRYSQSINESAINESIDPIQPISAIITQLLKKYELLDDDEPLESPALKDHFSYGLRWDNVLAGSNQVQHSVSSD